MTGLRTFLLNPNYRYRFLHTQPSFPHLVTTSISTVYNYFPFKYSPTAEVQIGKHFSSHHSRKCSSKLPSSVLNLFTAGKVQYIILLLEMQSIPPCCNTTSITRTMTALERVFQYYLWTASNWQAQTSVFFKRECDWIDFDDFLFLEVSRECWKKEYFINIDIQSVW